MTLLFALMLSAAGAQTTGCEVALTAPIQLPHALPPLSAGELVETLERDVRARGAHPATFALIEAAIDPLLQNITGFLQTRANYPFVFDLNEAGEMANRVHDDLSARLRVLRDAHTARTWLGKSKPVPAPLILQIRRLHFTLRRLSEDFKKNTETVAAVTPVTASLVAAGDATLTALGELATRLDDADPELQRRLGELKQVLTLQVQIVRNLHVALVQRTQFDALAQERFRRLLHVLLPLEATMGATTIDLSPLDPGVAVAPAPAASTDGLMSVDAAVTFVNKTITVAEHNRILKAYFDLAKTRLTVDEALRLIQMPIGSGGDVVKAELARAYVRARGADLTVAEVIIVAGLTATIEDHGDVLLSFVNGQRARLGADDLVALGHAVLHDGARAKILTLLGLPPPPKTKRSMFHVADGPSTEF